MVKILLDPKASQIFYRVENWCFDSWKFCSVEG